jgi:hypothetical protein
MDQEICLIPYAQYFSQVDPSVVALDFNELAKPSQSDGLYEIGIAHRTLQQMYGKHSEAEKKLREQSVQPNEMHQVIEATTVVGGVRSWSHAIGAVAIYQAVTVVWKPLPDESSRMRRARAVELPRAHYYMQLFCSKESDPTGVLTVEALKQAKEQLDEPSKRGEYAVTLLRPEQSSLMGKSFESIGMYPVAAGRYAVRGATQPWKSNEPCVLYANMSPGQGMLTLSTPPES